ncbi:MAG: hypothetical protein HWD61_14950 [Parachlamydiaceae bacterium]|nr:MAG: hypothetical protein HWD61_14950 [Parachlamydiaceae bacterium]
MLELRRQTSNIEIKRISFGASGKKENLDRLNEALPKDLKHFEIHIPKYWGFIAQKLIWEANPELKLQIQKILDLKCTPKEQSQQILALLSNAQFDESICAGIDIDGDLIVRSSARLEDLGKNAAAGIFSSIVVKDRQKLPQAFREVFMSAFSEKALAYYANLDLQDKEAIFDMGSIVQQYISDGEYSGVAFSAADSKNWDVAGLQLVKGLGGEWMGRKHPYKYCLTQGINY